MRTSYTVDQANRTLPLVSRIVGDIVSLYPPWRDRVNELEVRSGGVTLDAPDQRIAELEREAQEIAAEIDGCIREIRDLGIEYRLPLDAGLVDFPGERDGRRIFLCWRLGEDAVGHWHETDAGYAGRRRIEEESSGVATIHPERR
jgi:hypothetical protein